jgi:CheY-like chemotaxis protein
VVLELALPDGARLEAKAVVAFVNVKGMGIRFVLSPEQDDLLSAAIARISARPRRALVVDDDALIRMVLTDALAARGFEVICAEDGERGLRTLSEELLALDLLVTDACMPGMDGETFIRTIRKAGGEADLAIVAVTGVNEGALERKLEAAGADAVLEKSLGPELIAQGADAVLERKRVVQQADAA